MTSAPVSVVIVSRHRPDALRKCLLALTFQTLPEFEVIVVGDAGIADVLQDLQFTDRVKYQQFEEPNISRARNKGTALAAHEVIAFIDDDAIAEPTWLQRLTAPFSDDRVAAAGGFVRGRNGISFQWKAEAVDPTGESEPLDIAETAILEGAAGRAIKTQGTNCAVRRSILAELGGFDESFHFYLDETDLNLRIAKAGRSTAIVPSAEVQHGFAASDKRTSNRAPKSLFDEGASQAHLLRKHGQTAASFEAFRTQQKQRLDKLLISGELEPRDIESLLKTLDEGRVDGKKRESIPAQFPKNSPPNKPFKSHDAAPNTFLHAHWSDRKKLFETARLNAAAGIGTTVLLMSYTSLFHHRWFHEDGFWVQSGGLFGKSLRSDPLFKRYILKERARREFNMLKDSRIFHSAP